jgi:hypothetical protein
MLSHTVHGGTTYLQNGSINKSGVYRIVNPIDNKSESGSKIAETTDNKEWRNDKTTMPFDTVVEMLRKDGWIGIGMYLQ